MNIFQRFVSGSVAALFFAIGLFGPFRAMAATAPNLGTADSFSVLGGTTITNTGTTVIGEDLGLSPGTSVTGFTFSVVPGPGIVNGQTHIADGAAGTAQTDATSAFTSLGQPCDFGPFGPTDLAGQTLVPGVYCYSSSVQISVGGVLHLDAGGDPAAVWIFRAGSTLTTISGASVVFDNVGSACNVFWQVGSSATLGTTTSFVGTIIAADDITLNTGATVDGRVFARGVSADGAVTLDTNTISGPTCAAATPTTSGGSTQFTGTINVVKLVVNDNGGTGVVADFPLFINGTQVISGETNSFVANSSQYTVTETSNASYATTFSGDCDADGVMYLHAAEHLFCIVTNNDIGAPVVVPPVPPLIDVVKVPSPLALPDGPGTVLYTYTTRNIGPVPMTDVTMVGDTCSPIVRISGDTNGDNILDLTEVWTYTCSTTLSETHTNTVVATGWANGLSATDVASATVVVGVPTVPPLIHVVKVPNPLTLLSGGGSVTYTETITNPGTVALSNVTLSDDKCSPMNRISGDTNGDGLLDPTESWLYTCTSSLTETTTNTATASGEANGITVRDLAIATVVVAAAVPTFPNTGFAPTSNILAVFAIALALLTAIFFLFLRRNGAK